MGFDYSNTCPDIDKNLKHFKQDIENLVDEIVEEINPLFKGEDRINYVQSSANYLYDIFEKYFENVREQNSDMRKVAEKQIDELEYENKEFSDEIDYLRKELYKFTDEQ